MRRETSLRIGVHHANAVVWEPVYRTHLMHRDPLRDVHSSLRAVPREVARPEAAAADLLLEVVALHDDDVGSGYRSARFGSIDAHGGFSAPGGGRGGRPRGGSIEFGPPEEGADRARHLAVAVVGPSRRRARWTAAGSDATRRGAAREAAATEKAARLARGRMDRPPG